MKKLGIIQPGRLGDLIICLPIANFYYERGYRVYWPIFHKFVTMMTEAAPYIDFRPTTDDVYHCVPQAKSMLYKCDEILDLAATFPGSQVTEQYVKEGDGFGKERFDEFKYKIAKVPFNEKWNLKYDRNLKEEERVFTSYVKQEKFDIFSIKHSKGKLNVSFESKHQLIEINENHSIFHWRKVLENAQTIALVDSAMANFVEQLQTKNKKILLMKPGQPGPTFRGDWKIIPAQ
jgi:hypothetical protein